jgi:hypothetical protein
MHRFVRRPGQRGACFADGTAMNCLCIGPQPPAVGLAEKGTSHAVNALFLVAGDKRWQNDEEDGKGQLALTDKAPGRKMEIFR